MNLKSWLIFISLFSSAALLALQVPFTKLAGSNVSFTLFDFFAPMVGGFLGPVFGVISVLGVEILNLALKQQVPTTGSIIRLFPVLFGVLYFSLVNKKDKNSKLILAIPVISILVFLAHPTGRSVWYYTLFWIIPLLAYYKRDNLFIKSLGTTFTAHSVGGAAWIWAFNLPATVWNSLIPVVIQERLLFAVGISVSYLITKKVLSILIAKKYLPKLPLIAS